MPFGKLGTLICCCSFWGISVKGNKTANEGHLDCPSPSVEEKNNNVTQARRFISLLVLCKAGHTPGDCQVWTDFENVGGTTDRRTI